MLPRCTFELCCHNDQLRRWALLASLVLFSGCIAPAPNLHRGERAAPAGIATLPMKPLSEVSEESTADQLRLAQEQGYADQAVIDWILRNLAAASGELAAGEYLVDYALTAPRGFHEWRTDRTEWQTPGDANAHLRVYVRDGADGRMVPGVGVRATIMDADGRALASKSLPFALDPALNYYGENFTLPSAARYRIRVEIDPPTYRRHDPVNGDRFADKTYAEFRDVGFTAERVPRVAEDRADRPAYVATAISPELTNLARRDGEALQHTFAEMADNTAVDGAEVRVGDYLVAYAVEYAEGYWHPHGSDLQYNTRVAASAETNAHVEVSVRDAATGRFIPDLKISATLHDARGREVGTHEIPFMWHPWLYHYGENWRVPGTGRYRLHIHVAPPAYRRYGRDYGKQFADAVEVDFNDVFIHAGQK